MAGAEPETVRRILVLFKFAMISGRQGLIVSSGRSDRPWAAHSISGAEYRTLLSPEAVGRRMKLTPCHSLEPRLRISGGIPPSSYVMSQLLTEYRVKVTFFVKKCATFVMYINSLMAVGI